MRKKVKIKCQFCKKEREVSYDPRIISTMPRPCGSCSAKRRHKSLDLHNKELWKSPCKKCGTIRTYTHIKSWKQRHELCVSCSQIKTTEHYNREYQKYKGKVWTETNKQPIHILENFDKRAKSGVIGAYQLDHIISIKFGFDNKISPDVIGNITNLRMVPWEENIKKGSKIITPELSMK